MTTSDLLFADLTGQQTDQARREMAHQFEILWRERWQRLGLTCVAFAICAIYLPIWVCLLCALVNLLAEIASMRMMHDLDPKAQPREHWAVMTMVFALEVAYCLPAGMIWQLTDPSAKAYALGMIMMTIIHLTTVRAIYLPHGFAGFLGLALTVAVSNATYWAGLGDIGALAVSSVCAAAGVGYGITAMISNNRLHRATAQDRLSAQQADAAKSRFLAQMSHELRTPLNAILGIGQTEMRRTDDGQTRDRLGILVRAAEGLGVVLDDLLDMSAIQSGRLAIVPSDASPREVLAATIRLFELQADQARLTLTFVPADSLPEMAHFDAQRLRQCLSNLISNGLKYTPQGGVTVRADYPATGQRVLRIEVSDTGPGIPKGAENQIFEPFMRAGGQVAGTGLGLAISRALARGMGGDLQLLPHAPGQTGAHFLLTIAVDEAAFDAAKLPQAVARLDGVCVLVVDDVATNRLVAETHLSNLGATVLSAPGGAEALAVLAKTGVDLVLLDMGMPDPDGLETFRRLRAHPGPSQMVPVVAMTADALVTQQERYLSAGLDGYLTKPCTETTLALTLLTVLGTAKMPP
jgi:signal transduction histidine kinase/CheY-like chemotaxis protein